MTAAESPQQPITAPLPGCSRPIGRLGRNTGGPVRVYRDGERLEAEKKDSEKRGLFLRFLTERRVILQTYHYFVSLDSTGCKADLIITQRKEVGDD